MLAFIYDIYIYISICITNIYVYIYNISYIFKSHYKFHLNM